ncbi:hypothetical protein HQR03_01015 [Psychrobacter okhotskensis]|jgi:uncharacterized membrane protein|uniref:hypothetical protein n=1 Tax=Psychrobacter okhotskensis TaxID=212403 RepID=UPI001567ADCE|nr:hypothetical protein [Psychrobacter okhotskensis]NRD69121.1 hypothetical protein [Psychrobacter okhotskensis]
MNHHSPPSSIYDNWRGLLETVGKIILRIIGAGLALLFGFWLIMASNMGPAYLPHLMNGALDFWIRMTLLGLGLSTWLITALWIIWLILRYCQYFIKKYQLKRRS